MRDSIRLEIYYSDDNPCYHFIITNESNDGAIDDVYYCESLEGDEYSARECLMEEIAIEQSLGNHLTIIDSTGVVCIPS